MAVRAVRGKISYSVRAVAPALPPVQQCADGEHDWQLVDRFGVPPIWRCQAKGCGVYGYVRRKGGAHRNGRIVIYTCTTEKCDRPAKIRSKYRGTGGSFDWACGAEHATSAKFEGRVPVQEAS
jgi:hypothetical protein